MDNSLAIGVDNVAPSKDIGLSVSDSMTLSINHINSTKYIRMGRCYVFAIARNIIMSTKYVGHSVNGMMIARYNLLTGKHIWRGMNIWTRHL